MIWYNVPENYEDSQWIFWKLWYDCHLYVAACQDTRTVIVLFSTSIIGIDPSSFRLAPHRRVSGKLWIILRSHPAASKTCPIFRLAGFQGMQSPGTYCYRSSVKIVTCKVKSFTILRLIIGTITDSQSLITNTVGFYEITLRDICGTCSLRVVDEKCVETYS